MEKQNMSQNNISSKQIWFGILLVVLLTSGYFLADQVTVNKEQKIIENVINEVILKKPICPNTSEAFYALRDSGQIVSLARNLNTYGENGSFVNLKKTIVKSTGEGSQIACGYLYVKAYRANEKPLQVEWEHPFVMPGQFGGHLETRNSILPINEGEASEFLYNLSKIEYKTSSASNEIRRADWAALLNVSDRIQFEVALNTINRGGMLAEVLMAYKCWSPDTGKVTNDCNLSVE